MRYEQQHTNHLVLRAVVEGLEHRLRAKSPRDSRIDVGPEGGSGRPHDDAKAPARDIRFSLTGEFGARAVVTCYNFGGNVYTLDVNVGDRRRLFTVCVSDRAVEVPVSVQNAVFEFVSDELKRLVGDWFISTRIAATGPERAVAPPSG